MDPIHHKIKMRVICAKSAEVEKLTFLVEDIEYLLALIKQYKEEIRKEYKPLQEENERLKKMMKETIEPKQTLYRKFVDWLNEDHSDLGLD